MKNYKIVWLPKAFENLQEIQNYISQARPHTSKKIAQKIKATVLLLKNNPNLGKVSIVEEFRQIQVAGLPFIICYKFIDNTIIIARIFHNKQNIDWNI